MRKTMTLMLAFIAFVLNAQQVKFTSEDFPGIEKRMINTNQYYLPLSNSEFLVAVGKANSDDATIIKSAKNCKTLWSVPAIQGYLSAAIFGKNILVFSADGGRNGYYKIDAVHATLLDNTSGKIIAEKDIATYTKKALTDIFVLTDSANNFKDLILRSTELERLTIFELFNISEDFGYTDNLQAISLDDNLNISTNTLDVTGIQKAQFLGCTCNNNNDIFLASIQNNSISVSRYDAATSKIAASVTAACNFEHDVVKIDGEVKEHQNNIWLACGIDEVKRTASSLVTGVFNFDNKSGLIKQDLLDKDYLKGYAEKTSHLRIIGTQFYNDKLIVIKEFNTPDRSAISNTPYVTYGPVIVSVYSSAMKLLKEVSADEKISEFYSLPSAYYKLIDNHLYMFYNSTRLSGIRSIYQVINVDDFSVSDPKQIKIDDAKLNMLLFSPGTIWFNHTALLPYAEQNMIAPNKMVTRFKAVDF